jgi:hypothetical protein
MQPLSKDERGPIDPQGAAPRDVVRIERSLRTATVLSNPPERRFDLAGARADIYPILKVPRDGRPGHFRWSPPTSQRLICAISESPLWSSCSASSRHVAQNCRRTASGRTWTNTVKSTRNAATSFQIGRDHGFSVAQNTIDAPAFSRPGAFLLGKCMRLKSWAARAWGVPRNTSGASLDQRRMP